MFQWGFEPTHSNIAIDPNHWATAVSQGGRTQPRAPQSAKKNNFIKH